MEIPKVHGVDCATGEEFVRDMTPEEIEARIAMTEYLEAERIAQEEAEAARLAAKESALAKLSALGLTEEEVQAIIG